jgi:uncharacterized membrane protein
MISAFAPAFSAGLVVLLALLLIAMPAITPATVPLGVAVPPARTDDPVVRRAIARYRIGEVVLAIVALLVDAALLFATPVAGILAPVVLFLVLSVAWLVLSRRRIMAAKRDQDWYAGVPVQQSAEVTAPTRRHPPIVWTIVSALAFAVAFAIGAAAYPALPDPFPVHFDATGAPDRFEPKTPWSVFGLLLIGVGVAALLFVLAVVVSRAALRATPGDAPEGTLRRAAQRRDVLAALLAQVSAAVAVSLSVMSVLIWLAPPAAATMTGLVVTIVLVFAALAVAVARLRRILDPAPALPSAAEAPTQPARDARPAGASRRAAPDDDRHWKAGLFYVNRNDPSIWVPRRFGIGWTLNLGHPLGMVLGVGMIAVPIAIVVFALLTGWHGR